MSEKNAKKSKAYRKSDEYILAKTRHRRSSWALFFSLFAIVIPFLYFAAVYQFEHHFYPLWNYHISIFIFVLGLFVASVLIPLLLHILECPFSYKKLFLGIVISLAFGYIGSLVVFRYTKIESDPLLLAEIICAVQAIVCTVFAVIGVNQNLWTNVRNHAAKKEVVQAYRRFEASVNSDPVNIVAVYALAQSDYGFAKDYMKNPGALYTLLASARQEYASGKMSTEDFREFLRFAAEGGIKDAEIDCARYYVSLSENDLLRLSLVHKDTAVSLVNRLHGYAEAENDSVARSLWIILRARLQSSMILSEPTSDKNLEKLLESSTLLKELLENNPENSETAMFAKAALENVDVTIHRALLFKQEKQG